MLDEDRLREDEYEKQYYGFSSTEIYEDFQEQVCKAVKSALKEMKVILAEDWKEDIDDEKLFSFYEIFMEQAKVPLQKFKDEARKIFAIPKNVLLDEDKYNLNQYTDDDIALLKKEVAELEKVLLQERVFLAKCKQQKEIVDTVIKPMYEKVNHIIKSVKSLPDNKEVDENRRKLLELHEQHVAYYFNKTAETEHVNVEADFIKLK